MPPAPTSTYRIGRGETGVLTPSPYKAALLPLWRFRTASLAQTSSSALFSKYLEYEAAGDFVGMDMARKYLQMGMTRAKRYANYAGGRKYDGSTGRELGKSRGHRGKEEKERASEVFRGVWERVRAREAYKVAKEGFLREQRERERRERREAKKGGGE